MTNREKQEKVIKGLGAVKETLEDMRDKLGAKWCEDAIALLKAREPLKPVPDTSYGARPWWFVCGNCKLSVNEDQKYCPNCGRAVKRE